MEPTFASRQSGSTARVEALCPAKYSPKRALEIFGDPVFNLAVNARPRR